MSFDPRWRVRALLLIGALVLAACGSSGSPDAGSSAAPGNARHGASAKPAPKRVVVPKLVGESFDQAVRDVERVGLRQEAPGFPGTLGNPDYGGNCLRVSSQSPPPGTKLRKGDTVAIVYGVCKGRITGGHGG